MRPAHLRLARVAVALGALALGVVTGQLLVSRLAHADDKAAQLVVQLPRDGVVFRAPSGRTIARLTDEKGGGVFELYDDDGQPAVKLRAVEAPHAPHARSSKAPSAPLRLQRTWEDPGY